MLTTEYITKFLNLEDVIITNVVVFQSTYPVGWDEVGGNGVVGRVISIHPPRGGWDAVRMAISITSPYFNPPTPWGVGHSGGYSGDTATIFQSTHPVGGGT